MVICDDVFSAVCDDLYIINQKENGLKKMSKSNFLSATFRIFLRNKFSPRVALSIALLIFVCRPVVEVILLLASSSDSKKVVVSTSELRTDAVSYP